MVNCLNWLPLGKRTVLINDKLFTQALLSILVEPYSHTPHRCRMKRVDGLIIKIYLSTPHLMTAFNIHQAIMNFWVQGSDK